MVICTARAQRPRLRIHKREDHSLLLATLPLDIKPSRVAANESGLEIQWSNDSHVSFYSWDFLKIYITGERPAPENVPLEFFGASGPSNSSIEYGEFAKDETKAVGRLTDMIKRKGLALVTGVPCDSPEPTKTLLEMIAFIRVTHYGGFWVFEPDLEIADTAYTNEYLPLHTDNTYFTDPAGIQAFHLLKHTGPNAQEGSGGDLGGRSTLLDAFHAARILREESPEAFKALLRFGLPFHASGNEGIALAPDKLYPVLECEPDGHTMRRVEVERGRPGHHTSYVWRGHDGMV
ncbi:hypothetical protein NPX13_g8703 [Xylaria arbuscula]|uniref:TauD/TfdA-like domain-containing protein n=1 Tax=Xylaria arbuscula TaxID=114810 RepID=A0A9W8TJK4_9PEZI|nr:hypothetical protein NPX13_g8703 [Xylaria arbuscula]